MLTGDMIFKAIQKGCHRTARSFLSAINVKCSVPQHAPVETS